MAPGIRYQLFRDKVGTYWWRLRAANNYVVANSAEGYVNKKDAADMIAWMRRNGGPTAGYEDLT